MAVDLRIHDMSGRLVKILLRDEIVARGHHERIWRGRDEAGRRLAAGVYLCRLEAAGTVQAVRVTLVD